MLAVSVMNTDARLRVPHIQPYLSNPEAQTAEHFSHNNPHTFEHEFTPPRSSDRVRIPIHTLENRVAPHRPPYRTHSQDFRQHRHPQLSHKVQRSLTLR